MEENQMNESTLFIKGKIISLCPLNAEHVNLYTKWMNSPKIRKYARYEFPQSIEQVKKLFEPQKEDTRSNLFFEIWHNNDEKPVGIAGIIRIRWFDRNAFIFYLTKQDYWRKGIATEAAKLVTTYGFNELNLHKISAGIYAGNNASIRVVEKLGFNHEITLDNEVYISGKHVDSLKYSVFKRNWGNKEE